MNQVSPDFFEELEARGLVYQTTDPELKKNLNSNSMTIYIGFDPTAESLHVGSLFPVIMLRRFQKAGHKVIALLGGATGMIGDPSFKAQERSLLSDEQLQANLNGIRKQIETLLDFDSKHKPEILNNADWFSGIHFLEFLRDVGKHFTINHMIAKESVRSRLEDRDHGISYTEFSYMLLQAFDFVKLFELKKCTLQVGGSDQWGNITAGTELIRRIRAFEGKPPVKAFGLTHPLLLKTDGTKFGKSETGTVWIDRNKTSPYQFYQYFFNVSDDDVIDLLKKMTFLSLEEIKNLEKSLKEAPHLREAQKTLAKEITLFVHGAEELERVLKATESLFGEEIKNLDAQTLQDVFQGAPQTIKNLSEIESGLSLLDALVETALAKSKGAARKDITAGGIYVNNIRISDPDFMLDSSFLIANVGVVLRKGKKNYHLLCFKKN